MRKSIFEILNNEENIDFEKELENITILFNRIWINGEDNLYSFVNRYLIKDWKYAKRSLDLNGLKEKLKITSDNLCYYNYDLEHSLRYIELIYNLMMLSQKFAKLNNWKINNPNEFELLIKNIKSLLEELNYEITEVEDRYEIIEKDSKATYVAESNPEIATDIIEYRKYDLKGDLRRKREILQKLTLQVEGLKKQFNGTTYKQIMDDAQYLLNNFHIRHNNIDGENKIEEICNMRDDELEKWYDITYNNILGVFIIKDYLDNKINIDNIKKVVKK